MDYSKFALELSSPEYIDYLFSLNETKKQNILNNQNDLYKGINFSLIDEIYQQLYIMSLDKNKKLPELCMNRELRTMNDMHDNTFVLTFLQTEISEIIELKTNTVILATGYQQIIPYFIRGIKPQINWAPNGNYAVNRNYSINDNNSIFVQNAEWHTHGFNSADLGLGSYRNAIIINAVLKKQYFSIEQAFPFQGFNIANKMHNVVSFQ